MVLSRKKYLNNKYFKIVKFTKTILFRLFKHYILNGLLYPTTLTTITKTHIATNILENTRYSVQCAMCNVQCTVLL